MFVPDSNIPLWVLSQYQKIKSIFLSLRVRMWSKCFQVEIRRLKWNCLWIREEKWRYWIFAGSLRWQFRVCVCVCVCEREREREIWEEQLMWGTLSQKLKGQTATMGPACYWFQTRNPFHWRLCPQNHQVFKYSSTGDGFYFSWYEVWDLKFRTQMTIFRVYQRRVSVAKTCDIAASPRISQETEPSKSGI